MKTPKKPKHKLYDAALTLFVEQGMTCTAIAEYLDIREGTLSQWRMKMDWDKERQKHLSTPGAIRKILLEELERVARGEKSKIDTGALSKISKTLTYFDGKIPLSVIVSVFKDYDEYNAEMYPHDALKEMKKHKDYLHHRAKLEALK